MYLASLGFLDQISVKTSRVFTKMAALLQDQNNVLPAVGPIDILDRDLLTDLREVSFRRPWFGCGQVFLNRDTDQNNRHDDYQNISCNFEFFIYFVHTILFRLI